MSYTRFGLMIVTATVVMFGLMYLNTYALEHVFFSETRAWMAVLMGAVMASIMLLLMWGMYANRAANLTILVASLVLFALSLWLVRSQVTVGGLSYMRAMIPHHSIAIMTSERAGIEDARTRELADGIIEAQERKIAEMRYLIADIGRYSITTDVYRDPTPKPGSVHDAVAITLLAELDTAPMTTAERAQLPPRGECNFRKTQAADPILTTAGDAAAMKLNGVLVGLTKGAGDGVWSAPGVIMTLSSDENPD